MKKYMIAIVLLIISASAFPQAANIRISAPGCGGLHVAFQPLSQYSFIDSVALDSGGKASISVEIERECQFFRLILRNQKLPMILRDGEQVLAEIDSADILESRISGSPETEYFLKILRLYRAGRVDSCKAMMAENPERIGNIFIACVLSFVSDFQAIESVATRFRDSGIPAAEWLWQQVGIVRKQNMR